MNTATRGGRTGSNPRRAKTLPAVVVVEANDKLYDWRLVLYWYNQIVYLTEVNYIYIYILFQASLYLQPWRTFAGTLPAMFFSFLKFCASIYIKGP